MEKRRGKILLYEARENRILGAGQTWKQELLDIFVHFAFWGRVNILPTEDVNVLK